MIRFALIVPFPGFIENAQVIFREHNEADTVYNDEDYVLEEIVVDSESVGGIDIDADVIIVRGLFAKILHTYKKQIPIIEIPVPATDLLRAVATCVRRFGPGKIGVVGVQNLVIGVEEASELSPVPISSYVLARPNQGPELVNAALKDGCAVIIGGARVCKYASLINIDNELVKTGRESFWQSITNAKRAARISHNEQEKTSRLRAILDSSHDGILSFDVNSKRIQMMNHGAEAILGLTASVLGNHVQDAPFPVEFKNLLLNGAEYANELFMYREIPLNFSKHFVRVKNHIIGAVVNIQEVQGIQNLEQRLRSKMHNKGHVAKARFEDIRHRSQSMRRVVAAAKRYALADSNVLLLGESGTGKELLAQSIHRHSPRRDAPFVAVNCAAIPETLLESELFGYEKGAFTGAQKNGKPGYFELAHGGSIFFDEIGELPVIFQTKLLRVLQEREIMRLGGNAVIPVNARILAATNQDLDELVGRRLFRQDLFFRLDVLRIVIPPLRDRREDIALLAQDFFRSNFPGTSVEGRALEALGGMAWPGNVRQLHNFCERLAVLAAGNPVREVDVGELAQSFGLPAVSGDMSPPPERECGAILSALTKYRYNRSLAARELGMNRSTLWRKMKMYGL